MPKKCKQKSELLNIQNVTIGFIKCNSTSIEDYNVTVNVNSASSEGEIHGQEWLYNKYVISNMTNIIPFGLENDHDLQNILKSDYLQILENLL